MWAIAQITSDRIYLLFDAWRAPDFITLHNNGHASLIYLKSGIGVPRQRFVTAHDPFLIIVISFDFYIIAINAASPPFFNI